MAIEPLSSVALFELVLLLLAIVIPLEMIARRLHLPSAAAQILAGMGLAFVPLEHRVQLDPDLILVLFLPPLLMSSAFFTVWRDFRTNLGIIAALAVGAVVFTTAVVGVVAHLVVPELPWAVCFALGAIVSPPDALAAKAVLQRVALPARMLVLLEGESLVNDASGLVLFRLAVAAALTGTFSIGDAVVSFGVLSVGGVAVGLLIGWVATVLLPRLHEASILAVGTLLTAWASYIIADRLGLSGVLSTVACGLWIGWRQHELVSASGRTSGAAVWQTVEFVLESLVFVLIGLSLRDIVLGHGFTVASLAPSIGAVVAAVIVSRFLWLFGIGYGTRALFGRWRSRPPAGVLVVMGWAGMRGVVSLAIALSLPETLPGREFILLTTFVVILVTVLVQGSTLAPLIRLLGVQANMGAEADMMGEIEARVLVAEAQLAAVKPLAYDEAGVPAASPPVGTIRISGRGDAAGASGLGCHVRRAGGSFRPDRRRRHRRARRTASPAPQRPRSTTPFCAPLESELDVEELSALRRRG